MEKYEFGSVSMEYVLENPELYIIPECLKICRILWSKGIDTVQCSNYEERETTYWVEIDDETLSDENRKYIFKMLDSNNPNFGEDIRFHHPVIMAERTNRGLEQLEKIANSFSIQDTKKFKDNETILTEYKRHGGKLYIDDCGSIHSDFNPERSNATLDDALKEIDLTYYDKQEGRLYLSERNYDVHQNYMKELKKQRERIAKVLRLVREKEEFNNQ